ncbi:MAG: winged helix-turn-helix domain-containing protein, partial [Phycisphaerae bacterium]
KEQDKVAALDTGADDYLTKPFSVSELLARMRATLRRRDTAPDSTAAIFATGELQIDFARRRVTVAGQEIHLTPNEYRLLTILAKYAGRVITHQELLKEVWGPDSKEQVHYLRVYVNQLRQKIEANPNQPCYLLTEPGVGYRFAEGE